MRQLVAYPGWVTQEIGPRGIVQMNGAAQGNGHGARAELPGGNPGDPAVFFYPDLHEFFIAAVAACLVTCLIFVQR